MFERKSPEEKDDLNLLSLPQYAAEHLNSGANAKSVKMASEFSGLMFVQTATPMTITLVVSQHLCGVHYCYRSGQSSYLSSHVT